MNGNAYLLRVANAQGAQCFLQGHMLHNVIREEDATSLDPQVKRIDALRESPLQDSGQQGNVVRLWLEVQRRRK